MTNIETFVQEQVSKYGKSRNALMPVLQAIVAKEKFLSEEAMLAVAKELDLSAADVFGTASFYTFLDTKPRGRNIIRVCKTIACHMQQKDDIIRAIENHLHIKIGETTHDNQFTLLTANCLGWCHKGPVILVNDEVFPSVTSETVIEIIDKFRKAD